MALPPVQGWMIDFRTAIAIFESGSNERIAHCVERCENHTLHICHCEEDQFKASDLLKGPFIVDQCCVHEPDDDIFKRCITISQSPNGKPRLTGNEAAVFITATALSKNYGVISNHRSTVFATVYDLCCTYGVPILSADEYFGALS